jgi:putative oxidoreductase
MTYIDPIARVFMGLIFLLAGISKIGAFTATQGYMEAMGVPSIFIIPTIILEVGGALLLIVGYKTRLVAVALGIFCILTALIFHNNLADQMQFILFMKNIAMAGGFLLLIEHGASSFSLDARRIS